MRTPLNVGAGNKAVLPLVTMPVVVLTLVFVSAGTLLAAQGETSLVSVATDGSQADSHAGFLEGVEEYSHISLSDDGRYVAFYSDASNLADGDTNGVSDIFVRDRISETTTRVSVATGGAQVEGPWASWGPSISDDGRFVAFISSGDTLVPGDTNDSSDVFVHDRQSGTTTRVSVTSGGIEGDAPSSSAFISGNGRYVLFSSSATNLVAGDDNGIGDMFVHDRETGATTRVSVATGGGQAAGPAAGSYTGSISDDGRLVAFASAATNLVVGDSNASDDVFVHDRQTGDTQEVSLGTGGSEANGASTDPFISGSGRYVGFSSGATNLVPGDSNAMDDIFVYDRQTGSTTRTSVASGGTQTNDFSLDPSLSDDGRYVGFYSSATNLVPNDTNSVGDVFIHDRQAGITGRASVSTAGAQGNEDGFAAIISGDGRFVAFASVATNLVVGDTNLNRDAFIHQFLPDAQPPPAQVAESVGLVDPATGAWYLRSSTGQVTQFFYGNPGDIPFMGDWDCDGTDTPGLYRQSDGFAYLRNSNTQGVADIRFFFGNPSDIPLAGDFDGDGCDSLSLYRPSEQRFYIINELGANDGGLGPAEYAFLFGNPGDKPFVGDFDGDSVDQVGLHRESTGFVYYRNTLTTGIADNEFFFGDPGDRFVAGDWGTVDGIDTPGLYRPGNATFYFRHTNSQGNADSQLVFGDAPWLPIAGEFGLD